MTADADDLLDLLSTSQKIRQETPIAGVSNELWKEAQFQLEQSEAVQAERCENKAPYIFYVDSRGVGNVVCGCCNSWLCARCGHIRARHEYGRIVEGCRKLDSEGRGLYFVTITCRGRGLSSADADKNYLKWTNRLLSTCRSRAKQQGSLWCYVQVTERQKREHPHSHIITTFCPSDAVAERHKRRCEDGTYTYRDVLTSRWFRRRCISAGLGEQYEITSVRSATAVAVYVAKYLFKESMQTEWAKGWKRVRYSHSFPKLERESAKEAFPLVRLADWRKLETFINNTGIRCYAEDEYALEAAYARHMTFLRVKPQNGQGNASY